MGAERYGETNSLGMEWRRWLAKQVNRLARKVLQKEFKGLDENRALELSRRASDNVVNAGAA